MSFWHRRRRQIVDIPETRYFDEALNEIIAKSSQEEIDHYLSSNTDASNEDDDLAIAMNDRVYTVFEHNWPIWNRIIIQRLRQIRKLSVHS